MNWYKKAQYSVEEHEAHPIPSFTDRGNNITDSEPERKDLPDTPDPLDSTFGYCLRQAFKALEEHPNWKLMQGPPAYDHPECTSHFWTVDENGEIQDYASDVVPKDYPYKGREVNPDSVREELREMGIKEAKKKRKQPKEEMRRPFMRAMPYASRQ